MNGLNNTQIYWLADIFASIIELSCTWYFLKEKGGTFSQRAKEILVCAGLFLFIVIATKYNVYYLIKAVIGVAYITILWSRLFKVKTSLVFIKIFVYYFFLLAFSDSLSIFISSLLGIDYYITIDGTELARIELYIIAKVILCAITIGAKKVFTDLEGNLSEWKEVLPVCAVVLVFNLVTDSMSNILLSWSVAENTIILIISSILLIFVTFYYMLFYTRHLRLQAQEQVNQLKMLELEQKHKYYEDKLKEEERIRGIYHDMKNHLLLLQEPGRSNQESGQMITALQEQISSYENYYKTGNTFLDIIIRDKVQKAKEQGIDFSAMIHFEDGSFLEPLDISAIFGNALDNAIEASLKLPASERLITIKANRFRDMLSIVIENNAAHEIAADRQTTKQDKFLHGFGLKSIEKSAEKYQGQCSVKQEAGSFILEIIIPIP